MGWVVGMVVRYVVGGAVSYVVGNIVGRVVGMNCQLCCGEGCWHDLSGYSVYPVWKIC